MTRDVAAAAVGRDRSKVNTVLLLATRLTAAEPTFAFDFRCDNDDCDAAAREGVMGGGVAEELGAREREAAAGAPVTVDFADEGREEVVVAGLELAEVRTWTFGRSWMMGVLPAGVNFLKKLICGGGAGARGLLGLGWVSFAS